MSDDDLAARIAAWREDTLRPAVKKVGADVDPDAVHPNTPADLAEHDFVRDVGLPGEYPFGSWLYPTATPYTGTGVLNRAGRYSGYGTAEDCRDYYLAAAASGLRVGGPNIASDLPSQLGWDSDNPRAEGEVGRVGVAIDTLRDFETIYAAFGSPSPVDRISSNWTINAPASVYVAFYCALAIKQGVDTRTLKCTPQNDILKEFVSRGLYIFGPQPSLRLVRDVIVHMNEHMPQSNSISICAEHMRYAGATTEESFAFAFANAKQYVSLGVEAGLPVDEFVRRFTFRGFGDSTLEFFKGIAAPRAARRIWARIMREEFGATSDRACMLRGGEHAWGNAYLRMTAARPVNNIVRETLEAVIQASASGQHTGSFPFDEPLGLGHSPEAQQVRRDMERILFYEAKLGSTLDPFAGSYLIEGLTDQIEADTMRELETVEQLGGAVAAVETGHYRDRIAASAWRQQQALELGDETWVGVNAFTGEDEMDVPVQVTPEYASDRLDSAGDRQKEALCVVRRERDGRAVADALRGLEAAARHDETNVIPAMIDCALAYASIGEICDVLRDQFGVWDGPMSGGSA